MHGLLQPSYAYPLYVESSALFIVSIHDFSCQFFGHRFTATFTGKDNQILHGNGFLTIGTDFRRNLESSTTYTAGTSLPLAESRYPMLFSRFQEGFSPRSASCSSLFPMRHRKFHKKCFFLPSYIKWFTNLETLTSLNTGSGRITRFFGFAFLIFPSKICFRPWLFTSVVFNFPTGKFTQPLASSKQTKTFVITFSC